MKTLVVALSFALSSTAAPALATAPDADSGPLLVQASALAGAQPHGETAHPQGIRGLGDGLACLIFRRC